MKRKQIISLLPFLVLGLWIVYELQGRFTVTRQGVKLNSELYNAHLESTPIDFDMLDEARPMDLIDLTLEFPEDLLALDGQRVRLVAFMAPYDSLNDMRRCMMFPSYVGCSFCVPPSLTQVVFVRQKEKSRGSKFLFIEPPSDVSGILRLAKPDSGHQGHRDGFFYVIDEATVTPYVGADLPVRAPGHGGTNVTDPAAHNVTSLDDLALEDLAVEVSELRELPALHPLRFERIPASRLLERVGQEAERSYTPESRESIVPVLDLLGFFDSTIPDWVSVMTSLRLTQRVAWVDEAGETVEVLDSASTADPFTRLELVKEIADALARQHFEAARPPLEPHTDGSRALEGLRQGNRQLVAYRYSRQRNISPASQPPEHLMTPLFVSDPVAPQVDLWFWLPWETGPFFVEARTGALKALSRIDELFQNPPQTTLELFRPRLYEGNAIEGDLIPEDFADHFLPEAPVYVERFGLGGLIPWMMGELPVDQAKSVSGHVLADRYALWNLPEEGFALLLETRWPSLEKAQRFAESVPQYPIQTVTETSSAPFVVRIIRAETDAGRQRLVAATKEESTEILLKHEGSPSALQDVDQAPAKEVGQAPPEP